MEPADETTDAAAQRHRRFLPPVWLLLCALLLLVAGTFFLSLWHPWQTRLRLVAQLESMGVSVDYEEVGPEWVREFTADHHYGFASSPRVGGLLDQVVSVRACASGRPASVPRQIPSRVIGTLTSFPQLERLDLNYTNVTDDWMPAIAQLESLKRLELGHARVSGRGFGQLRKLRQLEDLSLVYCPVRDKHLMTLAEIPSLKRLNLYACAHLTPGAILDFQSKRPNCKLSLDSALRRRVDDEQKAQQ